MLSNGLEAPLTLRPTSVAGSCSQYRRESTEVSRRYGPAPLAGPLAFQKAWPKLPIPLWGGLPTCGRLPIGLRSSFLPPETFPSGTGYRFCGLPCARLKGRRHKPIACPTVRKLQHPDNFVQAPSVSQMTVWDQGQQRIQRSAGAELTGSFSARTMAAFALDIGCFGLSLAERAAIFRGRHTGATRMRAFLGFSHWNLLRCRANDRPKRFRCLDCGPGSRIDTFVRLRCGRPGSRLARHFLFVGISRFTALWLFLRRYLLHSLPFGRLKPIIAGNANRLTRNG
jgi:hypothetical protein